MSIVIPKSCLYDIINMHNFVPVTKTGLVSRIKPTLNEHRFLNVFKVINKYIAIKIQKTITKLLWYTIVKYTHIRKAAENKFKLKKTIIIIQMVTSHL